MYFFVVKKHVENTIQHFFFFQWWFKFRKKHTSIFRYCIPVVESHAFPCCASPTYWNHSELGASPIIKCEWTCKLSQVLTELGLSSAHSGSCCCVNPGWRDRGKRQTAWGVKRTQNRQAGTDHTVWRRGLRLKKGERSINGHHMFAYSGVSGVNFITPTHKTDHLKDVCNVAWDSYRVKSVPLCVRAMAWSVTLGGF